MNINRNFVCWVGQNRKINIQYIEYTENKWIKVKREIIKAEKNQEKDLKSLCSNLFQIPLSMWRVRKYWIQSQREVDYLQIYWQHKFLCENELLHYDKWLCCSFGCCTAQLNISRAWKCRCARCTGVQKSRSASLSHRIRNGVFPRRNFGVLHFKVLVLVECTLYIVITS